MNDHSDHVLPSEPPLECIAKLFQMIRDDSWKANIGECLTHVWHIAGYGLYLSVGRNNGPIGASEDQAKRQAFATALATEVVQTPADKLTALPWGQILQLAMQIAQLFIRR